jgi:hypothetical protein
MATGYTLPGVGVVAGTTSGQMLPGHGFMAVIAGAGGGVTIPTKRRLGNNGYAGRRVVTFHARGASGSSSGIVNTFTAFSPEIFTG